MNSIQFNSVALCSLRNNNCNEKGEGAEWKNIFRNDNYATNSLNIVQTFHTFSHLAFNSLRALKLILLNDRCKWKCSLLLMSFGSQSEFSLLALIIIIIQSNNNNNHNFLYIF